MVAQFTLNDVLHGYFDFMTLTFSNFCHCSYFQNKCQTDAIINKLYRYLVFLKINK